MAPKLPHPLISEYDRFLTEIFRLNKQFLEGNPDIEVVGSGDKAIRYEVQTAAVSYENVEEEGKTELQKIPKKFMTRLVMKLELKLMLMKNPKFLILKITRACMESGGGLGC